MHSLTSIEPHQLSHTRGCRSLGHLPASCCIRALSLCFVNARLLRPYSDHSVFPVFDPTWWSVRKGIRRSVSFLTTA